MAYCHADFFPDAFVQIPIDATHDFRARLPRFQGDNLLSNLALVDRLRAIAGDLGASVSQLAIAWVAARGPHIIPLIGARTVEQLNDALSAMTLTLDQATLERIEAVLPEQAVAGERYDAHGMSMLDSER